MTATPATFGSLTPPGSPPRKKNKAQEPSPSQDLPCINNYRGYVPPPGTTTVEAIDLPVFLSTHGERQAPLAFFRQYIAPRKPVLIRGTLPDQQWRAGTLWKDPKYLKSKAGKARVRVETRENTREEYGQGKETTMLFEEFVTEVVDKENQLLYLTTQELDIGPDDRPALMSSPLTELQGDLPLRPSLLRLLVPQNMNLWMGRSGHGEGGREGESSSGLHHDYHDNLYILLGGRKVFRLYAPSEAPNMYTFGKLRLVHGNGRLNYYGQPLTCADGREKNAVKAWEAARRLEEVARRSEREGGREGGMEREEEALEAALEAVLDAELEGEEGEEGEEEEEEEDAASDQEEFPRPQAPQSGSPLPPSLPPPLPPSLPSTTFARTGKPPANFSRVDLTASDGVDPALFPAFPRHPPLEVEVQEGEMLYLPAGWFHHVHSKGGVHVALNYWFHPPDGEGGGGEGKDSVYTDDFWERDWQERMQGRREAGGSGGGGEGNDGGSQGWREGSGKERKGEVGRDGSE